MRHHPATLALLLTFLALAPAPLSAHQPRPAPARLDIQLPKSFLAPLPAQVQSAAVSPDGRPWFTIPSTTTATLDLDAMEDAIEQQWDHPSPQLPEAHPVLFERKPDGKIARAWFYATVARANDPHHLHTLLAAFDGKKWIEWTPKEEDFPLYPQMSTAAAAGVVAYGTSGRVALYDNKSWTIKDFRPDKKAEFPPVQLLPEPDDQGLLVIINDPSHTAASLFRYHNAAWTRLRIPPQVRHVHSIAAAKNGVWLLADPTNSHSRFLTFIKYDQTIPESSPDDPALDHLIAQLKDDKTAPEAEKTLLAKGPAALDRINAAFFRRPDDALYNKLSALRAKILQDIPNATPALDKLGDFSFQDPRSLIPLPDGRALLTARVTDPDTGRAKPTILLLSPDGAWSLFAKGDDVANFHAPDFSYTPFDKCVALFDAGNKAWIVSSGQNAPQIIDFAKRQIITPDPCLGAMQITAALPDGRAFLLRSGASLVQINPNIPDSRPAITPSGSAEAITSLLLPFDGTAWAVSDAATSHFNGQKWSPVTLPNSSQSIRRIVATGNRGTALVNTSSEGWVLVTPDKTVSATTLEELIQTNQKAFIDAFSGTRDITLANTRTFIHATPAGHIWLATDHGRKFKVLVKDKWLDASAPFAKAGSTSNSIAWLVGLGDGVFVADSEPYAKNAISALGRVTDDGQIAFTKYPSCTLGDHAAYDAAGGLWVYTIKPVSNSGYTNSLTRLSSKGESQPFKEYSLAAIDRGGLVWLYPESPVGDAPLTLTIWNNGQTTQSPSIPSVALGELQIASDQPGSIWFLSFTGLVHLASPTGNPADFKIDQTYRLQNIPSRPHRMTASPQGYLLFLANNPASPGAQIYTAPIPKP